MKYITLLCLLFISTFNYSQLGQTDDSSISKYSYYFFAQTQDCKIINGELKCRIVSSTGFLFNKNNSLYLISTAHSFFDLQHIGQEPLSYLYPTKFNLRLYPKGSNIPETIPVDVSGLRPSDDYFYTHADVFWVKVDVPDKYQINSIENLITDKKEIFETPNSAILFSYPDEGEFDLNKQPLKSIFDTSTYLDSICITENKIESQAALKQVSGYTEKGSSGAPLFLKTTDLKIVFGGMCLATNNGKVVFVRPANILKEAPKN